MAKVDKDLCVGCGLCPQACPDVFEMQDDGKAGVIAGASASCAQDAADQCPVGAIEA
jgi:ferredoxin